MSGFLVVGDVHGSYQELCELLNRSEALNRFIVFLGDIIDRGPLQKETFNLVKKLTDEGKASCIMGNHEYNAIMHSLGLRQLDKVHRVFLEAFPKDSDSYHEAIAFFKNLPLFIEYPAFNVIHACYLEKQIAILRQYLDKSNRVPAGSDTDRFFILSRDRKKNPDYQAEYDDILYNAIEISLKGTEYTLPPPHFFTDKDGKQRHEIRTRWWQQDGASLNDIAFFRTGDLPEISIDSSELGYQIPKKTVFVGHYWLNPKSNDKVSLRESSMLEDLVYCLDFSCVNGGALCGMCIDTDNDRIIHKELISVKSRKK